LFMIASVAAFTNPPLRSARDVQVSPGRTV
jgi:hypothetical protein